MNSRVVFVVMFLAILFISRSMSYADTCVKGNCQNGQGTYTWTNGDKYVGEFKDGLLHGQGTMIYADGSKYAGQFADDEYNGQGTFTSKSGKKWSGKWKQNNPINAPGWVSEESQKYN